MNNLTLPQLLIDRVREAPDRVAIRTKDLGIWHELTWAEYLEEVKHLSLGLRALGLEPGDKVAVIGDNHPEWYITEFAVQAARAAAVGLFQDAVPREIQYIVDHSDARFAVVEDQEQVDKLLQVMDRLPKLEKIVYWDARGLRDYDQPCLLRFKEVQELGRRFEGDHARAFETSIAAGNSDDLAVLCYTSGTTGAPKGAMLSHANLIAAVKNLVAVDTIFSGDDYLSFLPCGWIVEQAVGLAGSVVTGQIVNFPEEPETVQQNIREIGPRMMVAAPRIWENLVSDVVVKMQDATWLKRQVYGWGMQVGYRFADVGNGARQIPLAVKLQHALAERLVFFPLRDQLGLGKLRRAYTGGAALGPDTFRFFRALGVNLKQVYGQTEIAGLTVLHRDGAVDPETVGEPIAETELRISDEGEILSRSRGLFAGYYKNPEATAQTLRDGWLHSGDAGLIDERGQLIVLDRMKDVMVLADGRKFSPQYIENKLKFSPYIREAVVLGQDRPYVAALLNIDMGTVGKWAETHGVAYTTYTDLAQKPRVYELIAQDVRRVNDDLPAVAHVRRFVLLHKELDADDDEVTRTRKVRRGVVSERYANIIQALYSPVDNVRIDTEVQYQDGRRSRIEANLRVYDIEAA